MKKQLVVGMCALALAIAVGGQQAAAAPLFAGSAWTAIAGGTELYTVNTNATINTKIFDPSPDSVQFGALASNLGDNLLYASVPGGTSQLWTLNATTGAVLNQVAVTGAIAGLTYVESTGQLWGIGLSGGDDSVVKIDPTDGTLTDQVHMGERGDGIANIDGTLYYINEVTANLFRVDDPTTAGAKTMIAPNVTGGRPVGSLAYDPDTGLLYTADLLGDNGLTMYSIDPSNGNVTNLGVIPSGNPAVLTDMWRISGMAPTPEPATMGLLVMGGALLLTRRRR